MNMNIQMKLAAIALVVIVAVLFVSIRRVKEYMGPRPKWFTLFSIVMNLALIWLATFVGYTILFRIGFLNNMMPWRQLQWSLSFGIIAWGALAFQTTWFGACFHYTETNTIEIVASEILGYVREVGPGLHGMLPYLEKVVKTFPTSKHETLGTAGKDKEPYEAMTNGNRRLKVWWRANYAAEPGYGIRRFRYENEEVVRETFTTEIEKFLGGMFLGLSDKEANDLLEDEDKMNGFLSKCLDGEKKMGVLEKRFGVKIVNLSVYDMAWSDSVAMAEEMAGILQDVAKAIRVLRPPGSPALSKPEETSLIAAALASIYPNSNFKFEALQLINAPAIRSALNP
jgi:regulator of protease activity HflC (stomatin/prohibitin superfamily)